MINGGYAKQTKTYKRIDSVESLQAAFYWAEQKGVSRTGAYWQYLLSEQVRLEDEASRKPVPYVSQYYLDQY